jgi:hypothetical protein
LNTFKQFLKKTKKNDNFFPIVVHGKHASKHKKQIVEEFNFGDTITSYEDSKHKELKPHYESLATHEDIGHIQRYTDTSIGLNMGLIHEARENKPLSNEYKEHARKLDNILTSVPAPKKMTVFSGLGFDPRTKMNENGELHNPAYTSTSISGFIASGFARELNRNGKTHDREDIENEEPIHKHVLKVSIPKGSRHGAYVEHVSTNQGEDEFIIKRNTKFKINPTPEITKDILGNGHPVHHYIWHATID